MTPVFIIVAVLALFIIILAVRGFKVVQQAETMVIERLGRYHRTLDSGINIIWPIVEKPRKIIWRFARTDNVGNRIVQIRDTIKIDLRETVFDFPKQSIITKDNVNLDIDALLYFQVVDPHRAVYEVANLPEAIEKLTKTTLRNVLGELDLDETLVSRDTINSKLTRILDEATDKWGVKVTRVEVQDIMPPEEVRKAMEKQMRAERDRRAVILEADGLKESAIRRAEGEAKAQVMRAEAEAAALIKVTEAIAATGGDPVGYLIAMRYIEALKEMFAGSENKVVYLPYEVTGVMGSMGVLKEMFKDAGQGG